MVDKIVQKYLNSTTRGSNHAPKWKKGAEKE